MVTQGGDTPIFAVVTVATGLISASLTPYTTEGVESLRILRVKDKMWGASVILDVITHSVAGVWCP